MRKIFAIINIFFIIVICFACAKEEKKPYGAEIIDYEKVEAVNNNGPSIDASYHKDNPPMANKSVSEKGPWHNENSLEKIEPTADWDEFANDGAVPIYEPENK